MTNSRVLILYDYFDPAYKAGGPIRSLVNLVNLLEHHLELCVLTTNRDHDGEVLPVQSNHWIAYGRNARVQYLDRSNQTYRNLRLIMKQLQPDTVYINGVYSLFFVVYPLLIFRNNKSCKIVIAPRGMLQRGALAIKAYKKRMYLAVLKRIIALNPISWHVTTPQEADDLKVKFSNPDLILLGNISSYSSEAMLRGHRSESTCTFGTVALISPMKNIHLILLAMRDITAPVYYKIYGPIKDAAYWQSCLELIATLPENISVRYFGDLPPSETADAIGGFDFYIQPSVSENFGHSIFEAFNAGVPVIISDQTPWKNLYDQEAGWDVNLPEPDSLKKAIEEALAMNDDRYRQFQRGARSIADRYVRENDMVQLYCKMLQGDTA